MTQEILEKFTKEQRDAFVKHIAEQAFADIVAKTKAATDEETGRFKVIISDDSLDRQGDVVDQSALDFENYMKNPVVLWGHDYYNLPIGITDKITKEGNKTICEGRFAPTPEAQNIRKYYDAGFPLGASIGYILHDRQGEKITHAEVLEYSLCSVPANQNCVPLREARIKNLDIAFLATKGIKFMVEKIEKKAAEVGSACQMDDGSSGVFAEQDGELVCVPDKAKSEEAGDETDPSKDELDTQLRTDLKAMHEEHMKNKKAIIEDCMKGIIGEEKSVEEFKAKAVEEFEKCHKSMATEHDRHEKAVNKMIDEYMEKMTATGGEGPEDEGGKQIKSGASISKANREKIQNAHDSAEKAIKHAQKSVVALKDILEGGEAAEEPKDGKAAEKVEPENNVKEMTMQDIVNLKGVLREVYTKTGETLGGLNKITKDLASK